MFFSIYTALCKENNEKPYNLPLKLGAKSNSMVAQWKTGSIPRPDMLQKIADYFGVSVGYLMGYETEKKPAIPEDDELLRKINSRPKVKELVTLLVEMDDDQLAAFLKLFSRP